ncbi:hypothetical protein SAMN05443575_4044 [Jatrophihabitans endophyticus]|uniref:Integral membrane protein n=2 Tax=Jatrophihabitans endophyticus TaxID=1206085 RepID=A0A1M5TVS9_9ACTN|nr:hypothetical protein SAMN05443575_4044 [Jatrophihabitans endophyticus]
MMETAAPAAPVVRPHAVVTAARLMIATAAVSAISLVVFLVRLDDVRRRLRDATPPPSDASVTTAMTVTALGYVAVLVLFPVLTRHVTQGRNWARLATWGLAGLGVVLTLSTMTRPQLGLARLLEIVGLVLDAAVIALLVLPASSRWFRPLAR